jgi:hypothetical protein
MTARKIFISLVIAAFLLLTVMACSGTQKTCPAYSNSKTTATVIPAG